MPHGGIEPTVVGLRIQRPRPLDECDRALPARVDRAALRLEDAGPGRGRKHSEARRGVEPRSTILQTVLLPEQRAVGAGSGRHSSFEPYLRGADSESRTRSARFGRPAPRLEDARSIGGVAGYRPGENLLAKQARGLRTTPDGEPSVPPGSQLASLGAVKRMEQSMLPH